MKVGIITLISDNHGNRLQNYALQEVLTEIGNEVETLNNPWEDDYNPYIEKLNFNIKKLIYYVLRNPKRYIRKIRFDQFNRQNIKFSKFWLNKEVDRNKANQLYDIFICGSDQVWNSEAKEITGKYFADFANENKRASYAASFGIDSIVSSRKEEFARYLSGMKYISVREQSGVNIAREFTNNNIYCHLDPTFLLTAERWNKVVTDPIDIKEKYIFCYFLGKPAEKTLSEIRKIQKKKEIKVCLICNMFDSPFNNIGPEGFVSLIKNAEFVLTDSFHGTAFSIIYEKPFYTFARTGVNQGMVSRVKSILNILRLQDRFEPSMLEDKYIYNINFEECRSILREERKKSLDYLKIITKRNE